MKLYLFGGAETDQGQAPVLKKLINDILQELKPKQLLHIPYARIIVPSGEEDIWGEGWVAKDLNLDDIELLDARNPDDLARANTPIIFINGGHQRDLVYEKIVSNKVLYNLVMNANHIIGESAGSMVCGEYRRAYQNDQAIITKGLGILKDTIIIPHYSERNRQQALKKAMNYTDIKYGFGIDSLTGAIIDTETYPKKYEAIGNGLVDFLELKNLK